MWKWTNKKISYAAILVASSVAFVIIGSKLMAITAFPSFKVAFGGLPIKITGYLFGPLVGACTGLIADLLSFAFLPSYYNPIYSLIMTMSGFVPGIIMWIFNRKTRSINFHYFSTMFVLIFVFFGIFTILQFIPASILVKSPIKNKVILQILALSGFVLWGAILTLFKYVKKWNHLVKLFAPIIMFCSILEMFNSFMTPLADHLSLHTDFFIFYIGHLFTSPLKLITNIICVATTYKLVGGLVMNKIDNSY